MTTTLNISARRRSLPLSKLPKTFIDAVIVTRLLRVQYLWIDSLCILQDSPRDWELESSRMQYVYKNATVTIAATMASNSTSGFLTSIPRKDTFSLPLNYESLATKMRGTLHLGHQEEESFYYYRLFRGPLATRGWTVQEHVLASRLIHFGKDEIWWECSSHMETSVDLHPFILQ